MQVHKPNMYIIFKFVKVKIPKSRTEDSQLVGQHTVSLGAKGSGLSHTWSIVNASEEENATGRGLDLQPHVVGSAIGNLWNLHAHHLQLIILGEPHGITGDSSPWKQGWN